MRYGIAAAIILVVISIMLACSGGGGGIIDPIPTFDTTNTFPTFTTSVTTTNTFPTTSITTTNNIQYKYLYVKVLRKLTNGDIQWLGDGWNQTAHVYFQAYDNFNHDKTVEVTDGYYGIYTKFYYDTYKVDRVDIGIQSFYYLDGAYTVRIGDSYDYSSEAWYGEFTVNDYRPYGNSIYIEFQPGVTQNIFPNNKKLKDRR